MNLEAKLTKTETVYTEHLAWGASKKEVAAKFHKSTRTVENTARNIYVKTGVRSVAQLSAWWFVVKHNISPALNPLLSCFFLTLVTINEFNKDNDDAARKTGRVKVSKVKCGRGKKHHDSDDDCIQL